MRSGAGHNWPQTVKIQANSSKRQQALYILRKLRFSSAWSRMSHTSSVCGWKSVLFAFSLGIAGSKPTAKKELEKLIKNCWGKEKYYRASKSACLVLLPIVRPYAVEWLNSAGCLPLLLTPFRSVVVFDIWTIWVVAKGGIWKRWHKSTR